MIKLFNNEKRISASDFMKFAGLTNFTRKCIYEEIEKVLRDKEMFYDDFCFYFSETIERFNMKISFSYDASFLDESEIDIEEFNMFNYITIDSITIYDIPELLKSNNIRFEESNSSESIYLKLNGKEYRISTHKRPAFSTDGFNYIEHKYENEIIVDSQIEMYYTIKNLIESNKELKYE